MEPLKFNSWEGPQGMKNYIIEQTGVKPYSGAGINYRSKQQTTLLKSVDNTYYYDDNLCDSQNVEYTLFGHNGDQNEDEKKFNEPLLNPDKTKHIYLYRLKINNKKKEYLWYGKYKIVDRYSKLHQGKDKIMRRIIVLKLSQL
jgi:hypothetical protein